MKVIAPRTVVLYRRDFANITIWDDLTGGNENVEEVTVRVIDEEVGAEGEQRRRAALERERDMDLTGQDEEAFNGEDQ